MANAPTLLNDDGGASMATMFLMSHHGLRRDLARFAVALRAVASGDRSRVPALQAEWQSYHATLHGHHEVEDVRIFPDLRSRVPALAPTIDQLSADHRRIDPLLEQGDRTFAQLASQPAAALEVVAQLSALLDSHLALEEAQVIQYLRGAKEFPPPANEAEAEMYAQGFAWSSHGIAPEVLEKVHALLPPVLTAKLEGARAAFAARCERTWGPTKTGTSRTAIPDWLAGG